MLVAFGALHVQWHQCLGVMCTCGVSGTGLCVCGVPGTCDSGVLGSCVCAVFLVLVAMVKLLSLDPLPGWSGMAPSLCDS